MAKYPVSNSSSRGSFVYRTVLYAWIVTTTRDLFAVKSCRCDKKQHFSKVINLFRLVSFRSNGMEDRRGRAEDINKDPMNEPITGRRFSTESPALSTVPLQSVMDVMTLAHEMQDGMLRQGLVKDRKWHLKTYKNCFLHQDALRWLVDKILVMEQSSGEITGGGAGGVGAEAASVCSSFTSMENYLDELKVKAARLGNLMIKAEYLTHVCDDHQFDVNHKSKTLFFRFHIETAVRQLENIPEQGQGSVKSRHSMSIAASIFKRNTDTASAEKHPHSTSESKAKLEGASEVSNTAPSPVVEVDTRTPGDEVSVMTMLTSMSNASSGASMKSSADSSAETSYDPDRVVDKGLFSIVIDLYRDLRFLKKIKDRNFQRKIYKYCFLHEDCMEWLSRQVQIQYQAGREAPEKKGETNFDETPWPDVLTKEQSEEIAARIGNLMIQHGYVSNVRGHHLFRPNLESMLFFKFRETLIAMDYEKSNIGRYSDTHIDNLQQASFERETRTTLMSLPQASQSLGK
jgi:hypothetical protein